MAAGPRREARERALELLYETYAKAQSVDDTLAALAIEPDPFALDLVRGTAARAHEIDGLIGRMARGWALDRMPVLDRTILQLAVFELLGHPDVPIGVVISEAVELAKRYSTEDSGRFVNGVLASVAAEVRPQTPG